MVKDIKLQKHTSEELLNFIRILQLINPNYEELLESLNGEAVSLIDQELDTYVLNYDKLNNIDKKMLHAIMVTTRLFNCEAFKRIVKSPKNLEPFIGD